MARCPCTFSGTKFLVFVVFFTMTSIFAPAAYDWARMQRRTSLQAILTRMHPHFIEVSVKPATEEYYKLWRYYDFEADRYRDPKRPGFPAVPAVYVHGNAGCFRDMRSLGRFVGESVLKQRYQNAARSQEEVKRALFGLYRREGLKMPTDEEEIPRDLQRRAEEMVIARTPLLGVELFGVDFLEESNTQSGLLMVKEARFLNYCAHFLLQSLLDHYREVLMRAPGSLRREGNERTPIPNSVTAAESEYLNGLCSHQSYERKGSNRVCYVAKEQIRRFSSTERIRREVERIQKEGIWIWTESVGGQVGLFAAILNPTLYAGLAMAGPPVRYPPFLFDAGCVNFHRLVHDAALIPYAYNFTPTYDWNKSLDVTDPVQLLWKLSEVPSHEVAARVSRISMVTINGGALEDIVPPQSSFLLRSVGRRASSEDHQRMLKLAHINAARRDVCTEELRGCGVSLSHRGLVFALQLLDVGAYSLVRASLSSESSVFLGVESTFSSTRDRLFPTVVETLPKSIDAYRNDESLFLLSLGEVKKAESDETFYRMGNTSYVFNKMKKICVQSNDVLNLQDIPTEEDDDTESWEALQIFIGATTYPPEDVYFPELRLIYTGEKGKVSFANVSARAATKLHLPTRRKDSVAKIGEVVLTAISFQVLQKSRVESPEWVRPQFCFFVDRAKLSEKHFSFVQHDRIDPSSQRTSNDTSRNDDLFPFMGGERVSVEKHGRFALVRNICSVSLETEMVVHVNNRAVFPHLLCGSFRSFRIAFRGTGGLAPDEPEAQQQYFFGPYEEERHTFNYSWRPFSTVPFNLTNVYVVYVISAEDQPKIHLGDFELSASPRWNEYRYWVWWFGRWRMRWMAVLSTYSVSGKFAGCYVLLYFTLYTCFYTSHFIGERKTLSKLVCCWFWNVSPFLLVLLATILLENIGYTAARNALTVCLNEDPPLRSDEELTSMMDMREKMTLIFLYALPPRYEACKYSWIRMQSVVPSNLRMEHMLHIVCASFFAIVLIVAEICFWCLMWPMSLLLRIFFKMRLRSSVPTWRLVLFWSIPIFLRIAIPWLHISIITTIACFLSYAALWCFPHNRFTPGNPQYRWLCFLVAMMLHFSAHFEGLVLVLRNYFIVSPVVLADSERYKTLPEHILAFTVVQGGLGVVYGTLHFSLRHFATMDAEAAVKKRNGENFIENKLKLKEGADQKISLSYSLGDISRFYPRFNRGMIICSRIVLFFALWASLVSVRRPLEGTIALYGLCLTVVSLALRLARLW
ncbi:hypothetical protein, conserved [Trypanosoma cruzi]|uniref:PGAP1-like protein n=1 Tax=Trypanosoma cruzi (strain CL Brener) TaxID=353153 RepID=Q4DT91_TRYCC|nr:hypothetical protein, conserved [Trypanosoma cruzi]EAN95751.1 hypothetical protein, conserved [Trypanosoma cruzi]|eukprot:XP_817602.1 hypothetical protein [Trypanosoma cruzi strain CL Brener]